MFVAEKEDTQYLPQRVFGIIGQDQDDLAVRILSQDPLFLPPLTRDGKKTT